jgi:hypothetical protein
MSLGRTADNRTLSAKSVARNEDTVCSDRHPLEDSLLAMDLNNGPRELGPANGLGERPSSGHGNPQPGKRPL